MPGAIAIASRHACDACDTCDCPEAGSSRHRAPLPALCGCPACLCCGLSPPPHTTCLPKAARQPGSQFTRRVPLTSPRTLQSQCPRHMCTFIHAARGHLCTLPQCNPPSPFISRHGGPPPPASAEHRTHTRTRTHLPCSLWSRPEQRALCPLPCTMGQYSPAILPLLSARQFLTTAARVRLLLTTRLCPRFGATNLTCPRGRPTRVQRVKTRHAHGPLEREGLHATSAPHTHTLSLSPMPTVTPSACYAQHVWCAHCACA